MKDLNIIRGEDFQHIFLYKRVKSGNEYLINIEDYTIKFVVPDLETEEVLLTETTDFLLTSSNKAEGKIVLSMTASQTENMLPDLTHVPYMLYIEDDANDKRKLLETGIIYFQNWNRYEPE